MMRQATTFALIGLVNTAVDAGVFTLMLAFATASLVVANLVAWLVAVTGSYVMNALVTFARESGGRLSLVDWGRFAATGVVGFVANTVTLVAASLVMPVWAAKGLAILVSFVVNFTLARIFVFPGHRPPGA